MINTEVKVTCEKCKFAKDPSDKPTDINGVRYYYCERIHQWVWSTGFCRQFSYGKNKHRK